MRHLLLLAALFGSTSVAAQSASQGPIKVVDPPILYAPLGPSGLSTPGRQVEKVRTLELRRHPDFTSSAVFYLVAAVQLVGETQWKLCTGTFDCDAQTFAGDVLIVHPADSIFAGTISHDLKVLVYETSTDIFLGSRTITSGAFGAFLPVTGEPAGIRDPKLALDSGGQKLAWATANGAIQWAPINLGTRVVTTGSIVNLVNAATPVYHSPEPLRDPSGNARSFLLCRERNNTAIADAVFASGKFNLPPAVTHPLHNVIGTIYLRGGTALGGTAFVPQGPVFGNPLKIDFSATNCDMASGGALATLCSFFPYKSVVAEAEFTTLFLGILGPAPIMIPGVNGLLGLDLAFPIVSLPIQFAAPHTGVTCWTIPIPIGLPPFDLTTQQALVRPMSGTIFLGNNSTLRLL